MVCLPRMFLASFISLVILSCNNPKKLQQAKVNSFADKTEGHPSWIMQGNVYEVNVRQYTAEGTFKAFETNLQRLKDMGVQTLWFMPINPISKVDRKGELGSYYAVSNYTAINPEYGNIDDWKVLVKKSHEMGFKVIIDWVPNHTGGDHYWLTQHPDFYVHDSQTGKAISQFDWTDTRKLNYSNTALVDSMINSMKYWINESDIDGFRCDQAALVPEAFWKKCIAELKSMKNIVMVAESEDSGVHNVGFDVSYPWKFFHATVDIASGKHGTSYLDTINHIIDSSFPANALQLYFTSNHDENSWNKSDYGTMPGESHAPFAILTQTMKRSVPLIYSGQEEPYLDSISFFYKDTITFGKYARADFYKVLLALRKENPALAANATFTKLKTTNDAAIYAFMRESGARRMLVLLNLSKQAQSFNIENADFAGKPINIFSGKTEELINTRKFNLKPWGYIVYSY